MAQASILIVEDDPSLREALGDTLELAGHHVITAQDGQGGLAALERESVGMVISDVQMKPMDGHQLLRSVRNHRPDLPVVLMTAYGTIGKAVEAMRDGAVDYIVKPFDAQVLLSLVERVLETGQGVQSAPVCEDQKSKELMSMARRVAQSDATVMLCGESGTGKEVYARFLHSESPRKDKPFVAINCAAIPDNMLESVLFGYEKGAYTGAHKASAGKFEQAQGGTLLLDEISEMDLGLQAKILRVLQEREVERLGSKETIALDVRVLATTNRKLREEVTAGRFREDLFYRLNVFPLQIPALRERPDDILPLCESMIARYTQSGVEAPLLGESAKARILRYSWPGNVRELENVVQRALILCSSDEISEYDLHFEEDVQRVEVQSIQADAATTTQLEDEGGLGNDLRSHEERLIIDALRDEKGSRKNAAAKLGISPRTLRYKLARLRDAGVMIPG